MGGHQKKMRADKFYEDKEGVAPRLNELIRWMRYAVYVLSAIAVMLSLFFLRDAVTVIISLF